MIMKQNDWIIANINNPTFDVGDFQNILDMNLSNTQLLDKDKYLNNKKVRENSLFQNKDGEFSEDKFNKFYEDASKTFQLFSTESIIDNFEYSMWDTSRPKNAKIKNPNFALTTEANPDHLTIGISGINKIHDSDKSMRELAQNSKIFDATTGEFLDKTVNDISLFENPIEYFKSLGDDPLVYATYDEDTDEINPYTGKIVKHKKGEWKVNEDGEYYTEKLNGRSLIGKETVSSLDYLTSEKSSFNKYDFFDSDDVEKSVGGTIMKGIATVLPLFIPYVDVAYSGYLVSREISKSLPMLYGMVTGLTGQEKTDSKLLNTIAAYGQKMTSSTSDYAKNNTFSFENFGNLLSDVATQWGQQSFIASGITNLTSGGQKALKAAQIKALSQYADESSKAFLTYKLGGMSEANLLRSLGVKNVNEAENLFRAFNKGTLGTEAVIKSGDWAKSVYGSAAWKTFVPKAQKIAENRMRMGQNMSLAYMAVISNTDVYESILQKGGTPFEAAAIALGSTIGMYSVDKFLGLGEMFFQNEPLRQAIRESARVSAGQVRTGLNAGINKTLDSETKKGLIGLVEKGINIGKRTIEKLPDASKLKGMGLVGKSLGEGLEEVSEELVTDLSKTLGELAGHFGVFSQNDYGAWDNAFERYTMSFLGGAAGGALYGIKDAWKTRHDSNEFQSELTYLLRQGKKKEVLAEIEKLREKGALGSTELSLEKNEQGTYLTAENKEDSQNEKIYKALVNSVNQLDFILNDNGLDFTDDDIFDKMVQGEMRAQLLTDFLKENSKDAKSASYITKYYDDFNDLTQKILKVQSNIDALDKTDKQKRSETFQQDMTKLLKEKDDLLKQKEDLFGENSLQYVNKMLFAMDLGLSNVFLDLTLDQFIRSKGKDPAQLTKVELDSYSKEFEASKDSKKEQLDIAFNLYNEITKLADPQIKNLENFDTTEYQDMVKRWEEFKIEIESIDYDPKLEGETDEEYNNRNNIEDKTAKDIRDFNVFNLIKKQRLDALQKLLSKPIDNNIRRSVQIVFNNLRNEIENRLVSNLDLKEYSPEDRNKIQEAFRNYLKNLDEKKFRQDIFDIRQSKYAKEQDEIDKKIIDYDSNGYDYITNMMVNSLIDPNVEQKAKLTNTDVYNWFESIKNQVSADLSASSNQEVNKDEINLDNVFEYLNRTDQYFNNIDSTTKDFFKSKIALALNDLRLNDTNDIVFRTLNFDLNMWNYDEVDPELPEDFQIQLQIANQDADFETIRKIEQSTVTNNPVIPFIDFITNMVRGDKFSLENALQEIHTQYENLDSSDDFELSSSQYTQLKKVLEDIKLAQGLLHGSTNTPNYVSPVGHNKSLNEFVRNHSDIFKFEELPELSFELSNYLVNEINQYSELIQRYINLHDLNQGNREKRFENAEKNLITTQLEFFDRNKDIMKVGDINLLEGTENISDTGFLKLLKIQSLLNRNYRKLLNSGKKHSEILDALFKEDNTFISFKGLANQTTAKLDEKLEYSKLTDYDKFQILVSSLAAKPSNYYDNLISYIKSNEKLGPIAIQEHVSRLQKAQEEDPELVNAALDWLKTKTKLKVDTLYNATVITGSAGSGKTSAVSAVSTNGGKDTFISGPATEQAKELKNSLPNAQIVSIEDLVHLALGEEKGNDFLNHLNLQKEENGVKVTASNGKPIYDTGGYFNIVTTSQSNDTSVLTIDDSLIQTTTDAPKNIVIDEATWIPTATISLLGRWARKNNVNLQLLGDSNQNGNNILGSMRHVLESDAIIAWRTPKLFISLRDNNSQKQTNLNIANNIIDSFQDADTTAKVEATYDQALKNLENLSLKYYLKDELRGELVTNELTPEIISKIHGNIAVITDKPNSVYFDQLRNAGKNPILIDPLEVQGKEYDFVVIDTQIFKAPLKDTKKSAAIAFVDGMKNLYTLMSRSRNASIITDTNIPVKNIQESTTGNFDISNLVKKSRDKRIGLIEQSLEQLKQWESQLQDDEPIVLQEPDDKTASVESKKEDKEDNPKPDEKPDEANSKTNEDVDKNDNEDINKNDNEDKNDNGGNTETIDAGTNETNEKEAKQDESSEDQDKSNENESSEGEPSKQEEPEEIITSETLVNDIIEEEKLPEIEEEIRDTEQEVIENVIDDQIASSVVDKNINNLSIKDVPVRVYGNVSYSGIDTSGDVWSNEENTNTDLEIFLRKGESVETPNDKYKLVRKLYELKSLFLFSKDDFKLADPLGFDFFGKSDPDIQKLFDLDALKNARYFAVVEDNSNFNRLIGLTTLKEDKDKKLINGKVVKIVAKIKGKDGNEYTVSLGGVANPITWKNNLVKIKAAIDNRIVNSNTEEEKSRLRNYRNSLDKQIEVYETAIKDLTQNNGEIEINKPNFTSMTDLVKYTCRLEDINPTVKDDTSFIKSLWDIHTKYAVYSDIYAETEPHKGMNDKIIGKPVIYVSACPFLNSNELRDIYFSQKASGDTIPLVRQIVLDKMGISINSLVDFKYADLYTRTVGSTKFSFPFESKRVTPMMYLSMWNFRANLKNFLKRYKEFSDVNIGSDKTFLNEEQLTNVMKKDREWFVEFSKVQKQDSDTSEINESSYRNWVNSNKQNDPHLEKIKLIWKFNDDLSASNLRQFRLGYEAKHGAYLRKLTNLSENSGYKDKDHTIGVYIYPDVARRYYRILDQMFTNVFDKIIPPFKDVRTDVYVNPYLRQANEKWYQQLTSGTKKLELSLSNGDNAPIVISGSALTGFPAIAIQLMQILKWKVFVDPEDQHKMKIFNLSYKNGDEDPVQLDWRTIGITDELDGTYTIDDPAVSELQREAYYADSEGTFYNHIYEDLFSLMFHGLYNTKNPNDFEGNEIRATDAFFKHGIRTDAFLAEIRNGQKTNKVVLNRRLLGTNRIPGAPQFIVSLSPKTEVTSSETPTTTQQSSKTVETNVKEVEDLNNQLSVINTKLTKKEIEKINKADAVDEVVKEIRANKYNKYVKLNESRLQNLEYFFNGNDYISFEQGIADKFNRNEAIKRKYIDQGVLCFELESGDVVSFNKINGNWDLTLTKAKALESVNITYESVRSSILSEYEALTQNVKPEDMDDWNQLKEDYLNELLNEITGTGNFDDNGKARVTEKLSNIQEDFSDVSDDLKTIIGTLAYNIDQAMYPPKC